VETEKERLARLYPIVLSEYNPEWPRWFTKEKAELERLIDSNIIFKISHFGSTAVPNLLAKPTVDILLEINENAGIDRLIAALDTANYIYLHEESTPTIAKPPLHLRFVKGYLSDGFAKRVFHVHVTHPYEWAERLCFRDYLIAHPEVAAEYGELKRRLFADFEHDRDGYTEAKGEFIREITAKATE
jgi:Uncharacterized conserved protein